MASCNWEKYHGATESKAVMRHNDKEKRKEDLHSNLDIDTSMTDKNIDFLDWDYDTKCKVYDEKIRKLESNTPRLRKDRVTMVGIEIPIPNEIPDDQIENFTTLAFGAVGDTVGFENIIAVDSHLDEQHEYIDAKTKQPRMSMRHIHVSCVPGVDGQLNGKAFTARWRMTKLNNEIEEICQNTYGCKFMTGEKTKSNQTVEALKIQSKRAEVEIMAQKVSEREEAVQKTRDMNARQSKENFEEKARLESERKQLESERRQLETERQAFELEKSGTRKKLSGEIRKNQAEREGWKAAKMSLYESSSMLKNEIARQKFLKEADEKAKAEYERKIAEAMAKGTGTYSQNQSDGFEMK